ncbi:MAG: zinc-ribbon domain-containing protein [Chloroflexota bacterium]
MAGLKDLSEIWNNVQEFDLRPIRDAALQPVQIAVVGRPNSGRHTLANAMRVDPVLVGEATQSPVSILPREENMHLPDADLLLVTASLLPDDLVPAQALVRRATDAGKKALLVCDTTLDAQARQNVLLVADSAEFACALVGSLQDSSFLLKEFAPDVLALLPDDQHIALGRQFPLFRTVVARALIDDTCLANATYSFSTGLAEAVPVLTLPLSVTDVVVLTKSQAFLAYKLGLLFGFSTRWQDYISEFGSVIGSGFLMRQIARQLVSLIPAWGIVPKMIVAYSGTYVVGHTVLQWYLAGRKIRKEDIRNLSQRAVLEAKIMVYRLIEKVPKVKVPKVKWTRRARQAQLPAQVSPEQADPPAAAPASPAAAPASPAAAPASPAAAPASPAAAPASPAAAPASPARGRKWAWWRRTGSTTKACQQCGKSNAADARFCQYCGQTLAN